jgi:hypothetical protein
MAITARTLTVIKRQRKSRVRMESSTLKYNDVAGSTECVMKTRMLMWTMTRERELED